MAGNPTVSSASIPSSKARTSRLFGEQSPILSIASRNSWRSSALAIACSLAPINSTPYRSRTPARLSDIATLSAVWPPIVGSNACGRSRAMILPTISGVIGSI